MGKSPVLCIWCSRLSYLSRLHSVSFCVLHVFWKGKGNIYGLCIFLNLNHLNSDSFWNLSGKEHALVISNHRSDIDWLVGWVLAQVIVLFSMTSFTFITRRLILEFTYVLESVAYFICHSEMFNIILLGQKVLIVGAYLWVYFTINVIFLDLKCVSRLILVLLQLLNDY